MKNQVHDWFKLLQEEPGLAFMFGFIVGAGVRELIFVFDTLTIWFRVKLLGDRRRTAKRTLCKEDENDSESHKQSNSFDKD